MSLRSVPPVLDGSLRLQRRSPLRPVGLCEHLSTLSKHLIRCGLMLLGAAAAVGCSGDGSPTGDAGHPPPQPSYSLTLPNGRAHSGVQGGSTCLTVSLNRVAFTGNVALSVENLPTGVGAFFLPANPVSGNSSELCMSLGAGSPIGSFANLLVRGVASGLPDRTAPLTLAITAALPVSPFAVLTLSSTTVSVTSGSAAPPIAVNVARIDYTGPVTIWTDIGDFHGTMPLGVTAAFAPNPTTGTSSVLTLSASGAAVPGVYDLWIFAEAYPGWYVEGPVLRLTITAATSP
jgi:hypothetical protein